MSSSKEISDLQNRTCIDFHQVVVCRPTKPKQPSSLHPAAFPKPATHTLVCIGACVCSILENKFHCVVFINKEFEDENEPHVAHKLDSHLAANAQVPQKILETVIVFFWPRAIPPMCRVEICLNYNGASVHTCTVPTILETVLRMVRDHTYPPDFQPSLKTRHECKTSNIRMADNANETDLEFRSYNPGGAGRCRSAFRPEALASASAAQELFLHIFSAPTSEVSQVSSASQTTPPPRPHSRLPQCLPQAGGTDPCLFLSVHAQVFSFFTLSLG